MKILIFTPYFIPGFKGGGPIKTIDNMVNAIGKEINFSIVTFDRDLGDRKAYINVSSNAWQRVGLSDVFYLSPENIFLTSYRLIKIIKNFRGDAVHLNSFFSFTFSILPILIIRLFVPNLVIILGPRGEFSKGALALKPFKKYIYIRFVRFMGLYKRITWHASGVAEAENIVNIMGVKSNIRIAVDIALPPSNISLHNRLNGNPLKIIFLSRISRKKNLILAIEILSNVGCDVDFHVFGPIEDEEYWGECLNASSTLPFNVSFIYKGVLHPDQVSSKLMEYDLFLFPTAGENFGHVIAEALFSGLPCLISNETPWRDMESKLIGWDLSLDDVEKFSRCIEFCCSMSDVEYNLWRQHIRFWALKNIDCQNAILQNKLLFY